MIERCLWTESAPPFRCPVVPLPSTSDVAVIGGGYTGLAAAWALARSGTDVTLLERHTLGWGASSRNGGFVLPGYKPEMAELERRLGPVRAAGMFRLTETAIDALERLIREEGIGCDLVRCGAITLAAKPSHLRDLERSGRFLRERLGYCTELLGSDDLRNEIGSSRYYGGLLDPAGRSLQPAKYVRGLAAAALRAGARLLENTEVKRLSRASFTPTGTGRSAALLRAGMREVFPELGNAFVEFAWAGKVAYPTNHLPHAGRLDGLYYAMGYCGHGVALATYLGCKMGEAIAGTGSIPDLGAASFRPIPLYNGIPWFLPLVGGYYRARDWLS